MCLSSNQIRMVFLGNFLIRNNLFVVIGYPDRIYIQNMFQLINILQEISNNKSRNNNCFRSSDSTTKSLPQLALFIPPNQ